MNTKIIELFIDDDYEEAGIEAISLVSRPAHEENWLAFNSQLETEVEELNPYTIVDENFCINNPTFFNSGEKYSDLINDGWEVVKVQKITPGEVYKMQKEKFSNPNADSQLDSETTRVRYKYIGPRDEKNRAFCAQMLAQDRVYRIEDIENLSNPEFGSYNIFLYRGSFNCRHAWVRLVYKKQGSIINDAGSSKGLITEDIVRGVDTRNQKTIDAANRGTTKAGIPVSETQWKPGTPRNGVADDTEYFAKIGEKGAVVPSKKAPKSDTPNPTPKGEGTAKGDAKSSRGAEVPESVEKTLKDKVADFNERYKDKLGYGVDVGQLKSVYQRGVGAYNKSHSPAVKSSQQWALARVNAFLYLVKNGRPENPKYTNDYDLLPKDHPKKEKMAEDGPCWEGYEQIGLKEKDGKMVPNCVPIKMTEDDFSDSISDYPEGVKEAARRVLNYVEKNGWEGCGTGVGKQRANQLAKGEPISVDTVKRMYSYLSRHKVDLESSKSYSDGCGKKMYDAWGGDAALTWAERKLDQLQKQKMTFAFDDDKKILIGAAMVPNRMIHRYDDSGNLYYVYFSKDSIKKMANKFLKDKRTDETSIEHNGVKLGRDKVYITESWISEDPIYDKSHKFGFELPSGTWFVSMKVNDEKVWKMIKQKSLNGFSVEGLFAEKSVFSKEDKQINQIKQILKSINDE